MELQIKPNCSQTPLKIAKYAGRTLKESQDIRLAIEKIEDVVFQMPTKRTVTTTLDTDTVNMIYKTKIDSYIKRHNVYRQNKSSMYAIVFGQCAKSMRAKVEGNATFETIKSNSDVIALLRLIRDFSHDIQSDRNPFVAQFMAIKNFVNLRQSFYMTNDQYLEAFTKNLQVLSHSGVDLGRKKLPLQRTF